MSTSNKFYFVVVPEGSDTKKEIEKIIANANEKSKKINPKREAYLQLLKDFDEGKYEDISLRQLCINMKYPYQSVLNAVVEYKMNKV